MKIALICPSNMLYMPYVRYYTRIFEEMNVDYDIINWDRFGIEKRGEFVYRDSKFGHKRGVLDYLGYVKFALGIMKKQNYDKVIVFGIQLVFFMKEHLVRDYRNSFVIDIRDYNRVMNFFNIAGTIEQSAFTVLSSPGYKEWLPKSDKYVINRNTSIDNLAELRELTGECFKKGDKVSIGCIGALRDYHINIDLIEALKNNDSIHLNYHGEGDINRKISKYLVKNGINNVNLSGRYVQDEEEALYRINDIINVLRYDDGINNKTALPNRLYNAAMYGKPMLAFEGTQLSEIIKAYDLGLVINDFREVDKLVCQYLNAINIDEYAKGRTEFFSRVIKDNLRFAESLRGFICK